MTRGKDNAILLLRAIPKGQAVKIQSTPSIYQHLKAAICKQHGKGRLLNLSLVRRNNVIYISNSQEQKVKK